MATVEPAQVRIPTGEFVIVQMARLIVSMMILPTNNITLTHAQQMEDRELVTAMPQEKMDATCIPSLEDRVTAVPVD